jgi:hypothetical protein
MQDWSTAVWRKSPLSDSGGCVEVAHSGALIGVRDTKDHETGPVLVFTEKEWRAFVGGVASGVFEYETLSQVQ